MDGEFQNTPPDALGNAEAMADFFRTLANARRLRILAALAERPCHVGELEDQLGYDQPYVSQQLARLRADGIVVGDRYGRLVRYRVVDERIKPVLDLMYRFQTAPQDGKVGKS